MGVSHLFDLTGKVTIVTGSANGIGKATALMLAKAGANIAIGDFKLEDAKMLANTPTKRLGTADDVAGAMLYFASPVSEWVSGQPIFVNGGGVQTLD